jgi:hypothetical protein
LPVWLLFFWGIAQAAARPEVVIGSAAPKLEQFAAEELCKYLDKLFGIQTHPVRRVTESAEMVFFIGSPHSNPAVKQAAGSEAFPKLTDQGIVLRRTTVGLKRIEILKDLPSRIQGILNLTLDDDNIGVMPQLTTNSLHQIIQAMRRHGWQGIVARERFPGDHDWALAYVARAAWDSDVTPDQVARDQLRAICGEACVEDMLTAFHEVEAVTIVLAPTAFAFPADWPPATASSPGGMLMKYWTWKEGPIPTYLQKAYEGYSRALAAARKARSQTVPKGDRYLDFWIGRLEFASQYVDTVQAVQRSAAAYRAGNRAEAIKEMDNAMAALRQGLGAYARVARNRSDLAAIALVNLSYRELFQRRWSVKTWGY